MEADHEPQLPLQDTKKPTKKKCQNYFITKKGPNLIPRLVDGLTKLQQ